MESNSVSMDSTMTPVNSMSGMTSPPDMKPDLSALNSPSSSQPGQAFSP